MRRKQKQKQLTSAQVQDWLKDQSGCPVCGSDLLSVESEDTDLQSTATDLQWHTYKRVHCGNCGIDYQEDYVPVDVRLIDEEEKDGG
jgi:transcription elongation factor Elf1